MAKRRKRPSVAGIIKQYLNDHPEWLRSPDTKELVALYLKEHPGKQANKKLLQAIYNARSIMKKGEAGVAKRQQSKATARQVVKSAAMNGMPMAPLTRLEEMIDDCMILAKQINQENLLSALMDLRRARNTVVRIQEA